LGKVGGGDARERQIERGKEREGERGGEGTLHGKTKALRGKE
jgi:hypothetical protein